MRFGAKRFCQPGCGLGAETAFERPARTYGGPDDRIRAPGLPPFRDDVGRVLMSLDGRWTAGAVAQVNVADALGVR